MLDYVYELHNKIDSLNEALDTQQSATAVREEYTFKTCHGCNGSWREDWMHRCNNCDQLSCIDCLNSLSDMCYNCGDGAKEVLFFGERLLIVKNH